MKDFRISLLAFVLLSLPLTVQGDEQIKLKYLQTLYADAEGAPLLSPEGVTCTERNLFVVDSGNRRIVRFSYQDGEVKQDLEFSVGKIFPLMIQEGSGGNLYLLDGKDRKILIYTADGTFKGTLETKGLPEPQKFVPRSFRIAGDGKLFVLDLFSARVLVLRSDGSYLRQLPFPAGDRFFSDLTVDQEGNVFLLDSVKAVIFTAQNGSDDFVPLTGGMKENMNFPTSLSVDPYGNLYVVDKYGSGLALVGKDGTFLGRKLGMGWSDSKLHYPTAVSISRRGDVFVADWGNNRVQQFTPADRTLDSK